MSESPEYTTETATTTPVVTASETVAERTLVTKPNRLYQVAAWVGIVAGSVFVVAVIFFSGFMLGKQSGGHGHFGWPRGAGMMMDRQGPPMHRGGPFGGPGGPGMMWPGGPDQGGPGNPGPGNFGPGGQGGPGQPPAPPTR